MTLLTTDFQPEQSSGFLFLNITEVISFFLHYVSSFSNSRPLSLIPSIMDISSNCSSHLYADIPKFCFLLFHQADLSKDNTPLKNPSVDPSTFRIESKPLMVSILTTFQIIFIFQNLIEISSVYIYLGLLYPKHLLL